jgi:ribosomal protein L37E
MNNTWDKCKNCGGERGLHHYQTDQCPVGGYEAPVGRKQEWKSTVFEIETANEIEDLRETVEKLLARVDEIEHALSAVRK